jgi:putative ABC transport system permease protein
LAGVSSGATKSLRPLQSSLALPIGACTSAFRLIDALLLRPLPVAHPERLYVLSRHGTGFDNKPGEWDSWANPDFQLIRAAAKDQAELIAISYADRADVTYKTAAETEKATLQYVSGWMFSTSRFSRRWGGC